MTIEIKHDFFYTEFGCCFDHDDDVLCYCEPVISVMIKEDTTIIQVRHFDKQSEVLDSTGGPYEF